VAHTVGMRWVGSRLIGFRWSRGVKRLLFLSGLAVATGTAVRLWLPGWQAMAIGGVIAFAGSLASLRGLALRLGDDHVLIRACGRVPGVNRLLHFRSV